MATKSFPRIMAKALPEAEQEHSDHLNTLLFHLADYEWRYEVAWELGQYSDQLASSLGDEANQHQPMSPEWKHLRLQRDHVFAWVNMALREAAFTIFHYAITLDSICKGIHNNPTFMSYVDLSLLHQAQPAFKARFREPERIRNAVGHEAELVRTPSLQKGNAYKPSPSLSVTSLSADSRLITGAENPRDMPHTGRVLCHAIDGYLVSAELSSEGLLCFQTTTQTVLRAIAPAAEKTRRILGEEFARSRGIVLPKDP